MRLFFPTFFLTLSTWIAGTAAATLPIVVAHAGGRVDAPENTLPAIADSFNIGSDWVEVDLRLTADNELMLMHDSTVDRTTDGAGPVVNLTLAQAKILDAGSWFDVQFAGTEIPTLEEALIAAAGRGPLLLDMKVSLIGSEIAAALAAVGGQADDILVWTTGYSEILQAQTYLPGVRIFHQLLATNAANLADLANMGVDGVSLLWPDYISPELIDAGHALGLDVFVWAANNPQSIATALAWGVDGIHHPSPNFIVNFLAIPDCSDGADNDLDGHVDYPADPGCSSPSSASESPIPNVPALGTWGRLVLGGIIAGTGELGRRRLRLRLSSDFAKIGHRA